MLAKLNNIKTWQVVVLVSAIGFLVYFTGLATPFIGDDFPQIVDNPPIHSLANIKIFFEGGTFYDGQDTSKLTGGYFRPLMSTTYSGIFAIFGANPIAYHTFQLLLCVGSAIILYLFFRYSFKPALSLFLSIIFLIHPMNSQVMFSIPSMQDALFFFFGILAMWLLLRFSSVRSLIAVTVCMFLSLLAKETGMLFVLMGIVYLYWWDRKRLLKFAGIVAVPVLAWLALKVHANGLLVANPNNAPIGRLSLVGRIFTMPMIAFFYLVGFVFPLKLASSHYWVYPTFSIVHFVLPLIVVVAFLGSAIYGAHILKKKASGAQYKTYLFFAIWFASGLLPHMQVVPFDGTVAEPWFYFSMAGLLGMIGMVWQTLGVKVRPKLLLTVAVIVIFALGVRTAIRGLDWSSEYRLDMSDIASSQGNYYAYNDVATILVKQGKFDDAKVYAEKSIAIYPTHTNYNNLGIILSNSGDYAAAAQAYYKGLDYASYKPIYDGIAGLTLVYGQPATDKAYLIQTLGKYPQDSKLWMYLAILEQRYGDKSSAKTAILNAAKYGQVPQTIYDGIINEKPFSIRINGSDNPISIP